MHRLGLDTARFFGGQGRAPRRRKLAQPCVAAWAASRSRVGSRDAMHVDPPARLPMTELFRREAIAYATRRLAGPVVIASPLSIKLLGGLLAGTIIAADDGSGANERPR